MAQVELNDLGQFLMKYGWTYAELNPYTIVTGFQAGTSGFDLNVYLVDDWVLLEIPNLTQQLTEQQQLEASEQLLIYNGEMLGSRFSFEPDGTLSMTIDLLAEGLPYYQFATALDSLSYYAEAYSVTDTQHLSHPSEEGVPRQHSIEEVQELLERYGLYPALQDNTLRAVLRTSSATYNLHVRLFNEWVLLEATPHAPTVDPLISDDLRSLLAYNSEMRWAKFSKRPDGQIVLRIDIPDAGFSCASLSIAIDLLRTYLEVFSFEPQPVEAQVPLPADSAEDRWLEVGLERLTWHVDRSPRKLDYDHTAGGKLPRNPEWRPYRFCIQDVLFGATVVRHNRDGNHLQVDVFLPVDIPEYEPDVGAQALTVFLLSEAYKCGGTMEIEFSQNVEVGHVPASIRRIAARHGVELSCKNRLLPSESRQFYAALTDFSPEMRAVLDELQEARRLSIERACYAIHHGVWSKPEAEAIILSSHYPDSVLGGDTLPEQRHLYRQDLQDACAAILGGDLDRRLAMKEYQDASGVTYDLEDDVRNLSITFDPKTYAKTYVCPEDMPIPWLAGKGEGARTVPAYTAMHVLVRARDAAGLKMHMPTDLHLARRVQQEGASQGDEASVFILVPSDFNELGLRREELINAARAHGIGILVCPESMLTLTEDAARRLASSRVIRDD